MTGGTLQGTEQQLEASLQARHVAMIAIGGIIGAGLFVGSSTSIEQIGPAVVISYGLAGLVILMIMRMLSEMAMMHPGAGSFTELVRIALGPLAGFVSGWLYWYFWVIVVAIEAIAGAVIIAQWLPFEVWQIGCVLLALMTLVNLFSARSYGEFEFWLSTAKVVAIVGFIVIAALWAFGVTSPTGNTFANLTAHGGFAPKGWGAVVGGVTSVIFALCGAEIATVAAAESKAPAKVIARMTGSVALRILLFYVLSLILIVAVQPWNTVVPGQSPFASSLALMGIPFAATIMNAVVLVAVLSCLNSGLYVTSRALFGLARHGDAPQALIRLNKRKVPARATLIASLFGYGAMAASILSPQGVFSFLVSASGALMLVIYLMVCIAQVRLRRQVEATAPETIALRMWLFPSLSYATIAAIVIVLIAMAFVPDLRPQFVASAVTVAIVAGAWIILRRPHLRARP
ncbi:L-asparagine transporter-like permease [Novosphingobium hassiacum]|uniref:L-asparagine transporter-like permease n=1 Tax=Novosphingobium hassiacum TaxID=173676 RepID=A0A7W5ZV37_9SPHN|nr:amino acid permease [Novosphingobium hassiacum]MBB3860530.1 L-asparagine transporter-like permease [Novosphingobium hassiacum]